MKKKETTRWGKVGSVGLGNVNIMIKSCGLGSATFWVYKLMICYYCFFPQYYYYFFDEKKFYSQDKTKLQRRYNNLIFNDKLKTREPKPTSKEPKTLLKKDHLKYLLLLFK